MDQPSLFRRGFDLGTVKIVRPESKNNSLERWSNGESIFEAGLCSKLIPNFASELASSRQLYQAVIAGAICDDLLLESPYNERLGEYFECLGSSFNEGDDQEIETVQFDALQAGQIVAEDLWVKISWLSFHEDDASLRFRFSFGIDHYQDVAADPNRQLWSAKLAELVFPESKIVSENADLKDLLVDLLGDSPFSFVERIVYFNAPSGGAYLHHDLERGHDGVVYCQLNGQTYWLALPKANLLGEIISFCESCDKSGSWPQSIDVTSQNNLREICATPSHLANELDTFANSDLINLINETREFVQQLIQHGYGQLMNPGDVLFLPQYDSQTCCWHSVFTVGEETGQALSFAIKRD